MNSADLTNRGFGNWRRFNRANGAALLEATPTAPGVYSIRCTAQDFPLPRGTSDILYVGKATNRGGLQNRLRQYLHPGHLQRTNIRMLARCGDSEDYEVAVTVVDSARSAKCLEADTTRTVGGIEDVIGPDDYIPFVNDFYGQFTWFVPLDLATVRLDIGGRTLGKYLEDYFDAQFRQAFSKVAIAIEITYGLDRLGRDALDRLEALLRALTAAAA